MLSFGNFPCFFNVSYYIADINDLGELLCDLNEMTAFWFTVGLLLKVSYSKLKVIRKDHRDSEDCLREMLATWLQSGEASAAELVHTLKSAGMSVLSKKIAVKHGRKTCACENITVQVQEIFFRHVVM